MFAYKTVEPLAQNEQSGNTQLGTGHMAAGDDCIKLWSKTFMQPLAPDVLTPFTYSVLAEISSRAWYQYYDRLGFNPQPKTPILRQYQGRAYTNMSISAQLEATHGWVEPLTVSVDGSMRPIADWQKPGVFASFNVGRYQKKIDRTLEELAADLPGITNLAKQWFLKTQELRWTQAEILQVMEEIERVGTASLEAFFVARHTVTDIYNQLLHLTNDALPFPENAALLHDTLIDVEGLVELDMAHSLLALSEQTAQSQELMDWLEEYCAAYQMQEQTKDNFLATTWPEILSESVASTMDGKRFVDRVQDFLDIYGHRCVGEGEIQSPRWVDDPSLLLRCIETCIQHKVKAQPSLPSTQKTEQFMQTIDKKQHKHAQTLLDKLRQGLHMQSHALNAYAFILAGTQNWALAAANEAMGDGRLTEQQDVFFFELEEMKEMMTGERNVSHKEAIQQLCTERKQAYQGWLEATPCSIIINDGSSDIAAENALWGMPGGRGQAKGPLRRRTVPKPLSCFGAIIGTHYLDSGWSLTLPITEGYIATEGTPLDPFIVAARVWHTPSVIGLPFIMDSLTEGAQTEIDGTQAHVEQ